jgi:hypothetical protein
MVASNINPEAVPEMDRLWKTKLPTNSEPAQSPRLGYTEETGMLENPFITKGVTQPNLDILKSRLGKVSLPEEYDPLARPYDPSIPLIRRSPMGALEPLTLPGENAKPMSGPSGEQARAIPPQEVSGKESVEPASVVDLLKRQDLPNTPASRKFVKEQQKMFRDDMASKPSRAEGPSNVPSASEPEKGYEMVPKGAESPFGSKHLVSSINTKRTGFKGFNDLRNPYGALEDTTPSTPKVADTKNSFEAQVENLKLKPEDYEKSKSLKAWAEKNYLIKFIPEKLLKAWGLDSKLRDIWGSELPEYKSNL